MPGKTELVRITHPTQSDDLGFLDPMEVRAWTLTRGPLTRSRRSKIQVQFVAPGRSPLTEVDGGHGNCTGNPDIELRQISTSGVVGADQSMALTSYSRQLDFHRLANSPSDADRR